ncbi:hypothetical protein J2T12_004710 [Paenibacillus anaericanus]|uniref:hypothetical protein n=1 Tax=Paenibacillus anaericanus TaxID=170367 RepID=UPI002783277A|nr:hypothetical protein [Paenibacillus anaericanus]MDQ0091273.1 hypothetical protein [Paenibacillus anaericanus]
MLNVLFLLLGLFYPFTHTNSVAVDEIPQSTVNLAIWQSPSPTLSSEIEGKGNKVMGSLESMGDISLNDDRHDVLEKKGKPYSVDTDPYTRYTEYRYDDITVGLYDDLVYYVHADGDPEKIKINGVWVSLQEKSLLQVLGEPDFLAEDGDVYTRGLAALKIYRDPSSREISGVDLFDDSVS